MADESPTMGSTATLTYTWKFEGEDYSRVAKIDDVLTFVHELEARFTAERRTWGALQRTAEIVVRDRNGKRRTFRHTAGEDAPEDLPGWVSELLDEAYWPAEADASTARWP